SPVSIASSQVNILHIRALVKADKVLLFDTFGSSDSRLNSAFVYSLVVRSHIFRSPVSLSPLSIVESRIFLFPFFSARVVRGANETGLLTRSFTKPIVFIPCAAQPQGERLISLRIPVCFLSAITPNLHCSL